jgi:hypothetical protein
MLRNNVYWLEVCIQGMNMLDYSRARLSFQHRGIWIIANLLIGRFVYVEVCLHDRFGAWSWQEIVDVCC